MSRTHGDRSDLSDKNRSLKKQIESLKREISGLQKELRRANQRVAELLNLGESDESEQPEAPRRGDGALCTNCGKGVYVEHRYPTRGGDKTFLVCNLCKDRKPTK